MGKVRLADIAERVGVSTVTVHNALSGQKGVSDEMRGKIQKVADELGYQSIAAIRKKGGGKRLKNIGVIIAERYLADYTTFYWKLYQEMAIIATEKGCLTVVEILKWDGERKMLLPRIVNEKCVEGLILIGEVSMSYIHFLKKNADMPVVFLDFYNNELAKDAVVADNFYGMYLMTQYLFERGFRKMAFLGSIYATSSIMDRYCGFYKALLENGESLPKEWLIEDRDAEGFTVFELPERMPEAFVCNCDLMAGHLIMKLEEKGYRVPEDVSVIGFDNYLYPGFPDKKITTFEVDTKAMVKVALEKVMKRLRNPNAGKGLDVVSGHIVEKESVKFR